MSDQLKDVVEKLKAVKAKKVFVQFGEGLKLKIQSISKQLEKEGFDVLICCEPCYGSCDIRDEEALRLDCDIILHIGHEPFVSNTKLPVVYWEYFIESDPCPILEKELYKLKDFKNIGLITSIQFVKTIPTIKEFLEKKRKRVFVHKALQYSGQVLGCNLEAAKKIENKVDCFLCISAGKFYGWGVIFSVGKPVFCLDLERREIYDLDNLKKKISKILAWNKAQLEDARDIGILVSWKKGQLKPVKEVKSRLEKLDKNVYILAFDEITPEKIEGLKLDMLINCACPRIGLDDLCRYKIPVINFGQLEI